MLSLFPALCLSIIAARISAQALPLRLLCCCPSLTLPASQSGLLLLWVACCCCACCCCCTFWCALLLLQVDSKDPPEKIPFDCITRPARLSAAEVALLMGCVASVGLPCSWAALLMCTLLDFVARCSCPSHVCVPQQRKHQKTSVVGISLAAPSFFHNNNPVRPHMPQISACHASTSSCSSPTPSCRCVFDEAKI